MMDNLKVIDYIEQVKPLEIIWKQDLQCTEDTDKLQLLFESYLESVQNNYLYKDITFKQFIDDIKFLYYTKL